MTKASKRKAAPLPPDVMREIDAGVPIDRGYAWVVVASSFLLHMITGSCTRSIGMLSVQYAEKYSKTYGQSALLLSVFMPFHRFSSPLASVFSSILTPRVATMGGGMIMSVAYIFAAFSPSFEFLCFTFGPFLGFGTGIVHVISTAYVNTYFYRYRGLANGLLFSGIGAGAFVGPLLLEYLVETFALRNAQLILGSFCLHICVFAALMTPKSFFMEKSVELAEEIKLSHDTDNDDSTSKPSTKPLTMFFRDAWRKVRNGFHPFVELLSDPWYLLYVLGCLVSAQAMLTSFFLIPQYGKEIGLSVWQYTWILFIQGFPDMISRSIMGAISDLPFINLAVFAAFLTAGQGLSYLIAPLYPSFSGVLTFAIVLAITGGPGGAMRVIVGGRLVRPSLLPALLGQTLLFQGVTWLFVPRLFGILRDSSGSWYSTFILVSAASFSSSIVFALLNIPLKRRQKAALEEISINEDNNIENEERVLSSNKT